MNKRLLQQLSEQPSFPEPLVSELQIFAQSLAGDIDDDFLGNREFSAQFIKAVACSRFLREQLIKHPDLIASFFSCEQLLEDKPQLKQRLSSNLASRLSQISDAADFASSLRVFRNRLMAQIIFRDLNRLQSTQQTCLQLSLLAEVALQAALEFHYRVLQQRLGTPRNQQGGEQGFLIIGMGKLGAWELNLSSDIDLIFAYPEPGYTDHPTRSLSNAQFFTKLGQALIQCLDAITAEGFVFRVDMRLRPWGESGALVQHFDELEHYYLSHGREWERYAMVKARVVVSTASAINREALSDILERFTYRRYIDFSVIEALREMKQSISSEVRRKRLFDDIKRGSGGIREVEFIAQVFQLVRGGRDIELRDNRLLQVLPVLVDLGLMGATTAQDLERAYLFLRDSEHVIQAYGDRQTQQLPESDTERFCLAYGMGFDNWPAYLEALNNYRQIVSEEFNAIIANPQQTPTEDCPWQRLWESPSHEASIALPQQRVADYNGIIKLLQGLQSCREVKSMHHLGRRRLDEFMPLLLAGVMPTDRPEETLKRILPLVQAIARRSAYLSLLCENPDSLARLIELAGASPWIAAQLSKTPALLDELLDDRSLYYVPDKTQLQQELQQGMAGITAQDLEAQMEFLRYFRNAHALRVAACEISGAMPLMRVSDYLTCLAEVILQYVLQSVWKQLVAKHGYPDGEVLEQGHFAVIGYGKLGGIELGHSSDLDLVFIYDAAVNGETDGKSRHLKSIDNRTFFTRMGQKIIHMLNTKTPSGQVYEVDMRLRPSGNSGLLVSSVSGFEKYQKDSAWNWEHQALTRARGIAGDAALCKKFERIRLDVLQVPRNLDKLAGEVVAMREKMRKHLGSQSSESNRSFHIKHDAGGIVDIEFMVQYAVIAWSHAEPGLASFTDNIRILENLEQSKKLSVDEVAQLTEAYKAFRSVCHRLALQNLPNLVDGKSLHRERQSVLSIWQKIFSPASRS